MGFQGFSLQKGVLIWYAEFIMCFVVEGFIILQF